MAIHLIVCSYLNFSELGLENSSGYPLTFIVNNFLHLKKEISTIHIELLILRIKISQQNFFFLSFIFFLRKLTGLLSSIIWPLFYHHEWGLRRLKYYLSKVVYRSISKELTESTSSMCI